jgi:hypothetical protein
MPTVMETLQTLPTYARQARVPLSTVQYWARKNTDGFADMCVVRIDGITFVDPEAAGAWLTRPRYPRAHDWEARQ